MSGSWAAAANEWSVRLLDALWRASWQGAIGIALVWILSRAWKNMPNDARCVLWILVCLKLILALSPLAISIPCLPSTAQSTPMVMNAIAQTQMPPSTTSMALSPIASSPTFVPPATESLSAAAWLVTLWLTGVAFVSAYSLRQLTKSIRLIRRATPCQDPQLLDLVLDIRLAMGLGVAPRILMTEDSTAVLTFGAMRPIVLISFRTLADCSLDERKMVLAHEFAHIARRDVWLALIPQAAQTLFYFHPLVWLACREFDLAREAACDEAAISHLGIGSDHYARLLLKLGSPQQTRTALCTPGVSSHFELLRRRIAMLDKPNEGTSRGTRRRALVILGLAGVLCLAPISLIQGQGARQVSLKTSISISTKATAKKTAKAVAIHSKSAAKHAAVVAAKQVETKAKPTLKVFHLKNADAEKAAGILRQVLPGGNSSRVAADPKTNSIVVSGDEATMAQISSVIQELDQIGRVEPKAPPEKAEPRVVSVFQLRYTKAEDFEKLMLQLYGNPSFGQIKFAVDERTNTAVVNTAESRVAEIRKLVTQLDKPGPDDSSKMMATHVFHVSFANAKDLMGTVSRAAKPDGLEFIGIDPNTNSIVVRANQEDIQLIAALLRELDKKK